MVEDSELLRRYAAHRSEEAFTELVRRRVDLVYSVALRQVGGDAHLAQDVTQKVFADLARKAASLTDRPVLSGWLYRSTQFAASDVVRAERRRRTREQESQAMHDLTTVDEPPTDWTRLRPLLDDALGELKDPDRDAIALRFFEGRAFADIGRALQLTEEAARKRVDRGLDKLAGILSRRGLTSTSAAIGAALAQQAAGAAPAGLASSVASAALAGATASGATVIGVGLFGFLASAKVAIGLAGLAAGGIGMAFHEAGEARRKAASLAEATQRVDALRAETLALQRRLAAAEERSRAAEEDAEKLLSAITSATMQRPAGDVAGAAASEPAGGEGNGTVTRATVEARYKRAQELARAGNSAAALAEFLWCYDEGMVRVSSYGGVRGSFLLSEIANLAKTYPPASAALRERRDRTESLMAADPSDAGIARDYASLNRVLGETSRTLEYFDRLPPKHPTRGALGSTDLMEALVERRRYADALEAFSYERMVSLFSTLSRPMDVSKIPNPQRVQDERRRSVVKSGARNVEILAGAGDVSRARDFARQVIAFDGSAEARATLQQHAARAGQPNLLVDVTGR